MAQTFMVTTQRGLDAVGDLGCDPAGEEDCSAILNNYLSGNDTPMDLHFPPGRYYLGSSVITNAPRIKLIGDGQTSNITDGSVTFFSDQRLEQLLWFNCDQPASNLQSVWLENLQFQDTSPDNNAIASAIRITNQANFHIGNCGGYNLVPRRYCAGTIKVAQNSQTIEGSGTAWTDDMYPGFLIVGGYPYEILEVTDGNTMQLALKYQGETAAGLSYAVSSGGIFFWADPGLDFTQYGQVSDFKCRNVGCPVYCSAGSKSGGTGTSRIKFLGGYCNGCSLPDSIAAYFGPFSDTMTWFVACNSFAFGCVIANGHFMDISGADFENAGSVPAVTGGADGYAGAKGVLVMSDCSSDTWGNRIINCMMRQVGTAIELVSGVEPPRHTKVAWNVFRSNSTNFVQGNSIDTAGECDGIFFGKS
jgi:hypothetical protein